MLQGSSENSRLFFSGWFPSYGFSGIACAYRRRENVADDSGQERDGGKGRKTKRTAGRNLFIVLFIPLMCADVKLSVKSFASRIDSITDSCSQRIQNQIIDI